MCRRQLRRRNVYRASRRADGLVALICLLAALVVAALIATDYDPRNDDTYQSETYTWPNNR